MNFMSLLFEAIAPKRSLPHRSREEVWDLCEGYIPERKKRISKESIIVWGIRVILLAALYYITTEYIL